MCELVVSTWIGIAGNATHWTGKLSWGSPDGRWNFVELERTLTLKDAKEENRKHRKAWPGYYSNPDLAWGKNPFHAGQTEKRFSTCDDVIEAAKSKYAELGLTCGLHMDGNILVQPFKILE